MKGGETKPVSQRCDIMIRERREREMAVQDWIRGEEEGEDSRESGVDNC